MNGSLFTMIDRQLFPKKLIRQFFRYGLSGVFALVVHNLIFYLLAYSYFPSVEGMLVDGMPIRDEIRARNAIICNGVAFFFGNGVAYYSNATWVFMRGRHTVIREFTLFSMVSFASFLSAIFVVPFMISGFGLSTHTVQASFAVVLAATNFVFRKFVVFRS